MFQKKHHHNDPQQQLRFELLEQLKANQQEQLKQHHTLQEQLQKSLHEHQQSFDRRQLEVFKLNQEHLQGMTQETRAQLEAFLKTQSDTIHTSIKNLSQSTEKQLGMISEQVEKRLSHGFEKTTATFTDIIKRLALIDQAQQKITELSSNVVSLQQVLDDKRSRGAFGEVQLYQLIRNVLPEKSYQQQYTLKNNKRCDLILFLPEPSGNIVIDAKFPLETFRRIAECPPGQDKKALEQQFTLDIKKHILDMMFIPAEAIFAQIHADYPQLIQLAHQKRVWLVSPTTMMAVLTTASAVLKDADTRKQVHIIQEHLINLSKDFSRFEKRMDNLSRHIDQAHQDVSQVHTSAKKISQRFHHIEQLEWQEPELKPRHDKTLVEEKDPS
jgi:DNA recombination protein RmuC